MPSVTTHFGIDPWALHAKGAFDVPLDGPDAHVYLDPRLLRKSSQPEFREAMPQVGQYYGKTLAIVQSALDADGAVREKVLEAARQRFRAPELDGLRIGHSLTGGKGRGIGEKKAAGLLQLAKTLLEEGLQNPVLFEVFTVVEPGIGADLISDLMAHINKRQLLAYSERMGRELNIPSQQVETEHGAFELPWNPLRDEPIIFPPHDSVADLKAFARSKRFDTRAFSNEGIRSAFDKMLKEQGIAGVREFLRKYQTEQDTLVTAYQGAAPAPHDVYEDSKGQLIGGREIYEVVRARTPQRAAAPATAHELFVEVVRLGEAFREATEAGAFRDLLHSSKGPRNEKMVQGVFRSFVLLACKDLDVKLSPESDAGVGPADFLFDRGASRSVLLEVKLSSSKGLIPNYDHQVSAYQKSHAAFHSIYLVLDLLGKVSAMEKLVKHHHAASTDATRPYLIVVDGRESRPASVRKESLEPLPSVCSQPRVSPERIALRDE